MDTLRAPNKNISVEYPQMYLADQTAAAAAAAATAANRVPNHVSPSAPPAQQLRMAAAPALSYDTQSTVVSVRWGFSTVPTCFRLSACPFGCQILTHIFRYCGLNVRQKDCVNLTSGIISALAVEGNQLNER